MRSAARNVSPVVCAAPATVRVPRLDTRPVIDGVLDDAYTAHARPLAEALLAAAAFVGTLDDTADLESLRDAVDSLSGLVTAVKADIKHRERKPAVAADTLAAAADDGEKAEARAA